MPGARARKRPPIEAAIAALAGALDDARAPWMIIGGIAVIARGVQRMTTDVDVVVQGDAVDVARLLRLLERHRIVPRIDHAAAFAQTNMVLLVRHLPTDVDLDVSLGWTRFEHEALAASERIAYGRVRAPMARVEDLLVFKSLAGRPRDVDDAVSLLTLYPHVSIAEVRHRVADLAELADAPEIVHGFDAIVRDAARGVSRAVSPPVVRSALPADKPLRSRPPAKPPRPRSRKRRVNAARRCCAGRGR